MNIICDGMWYVTPVNIKEDGSSNVLDNSTKTKFQCLSFSVYRSYVRS